MKKGRNSFGLELSDPLIIVSEIRLSIVLPLPLEHLDVISAGDYSNCGLGSHSHITFLSGLGTGKTVTALPFTAPSLSDQHISDAPWVEYSVKMPIGKSRLQIRTLPNQRIHVGRGVRYAVSINGSEPIVFDVQADEFSSEWQHNVIHGYTTRYMDFENSDVETKIVRIYLLDSGLALRELIVDPVLLTANIQHP